MRAFCNKQEDNFITYHSNREKTIENVRDWEKLNPETRKEYTINYYKTEKGHRKRLAQQKRYREKRKLIKENEKLKNDKMELLKKMDQLQQVNQQQKEKIEYLKSKIENKDRWCQLIADIGYDYDGFNNVDSLKSLIDELVQYALYSRDNYDYLEFQKEGKNG